MLCRERERESLPVSGCDMNPHAPRSLFSPRGGRRKVASDVSSLHSHTAAYLPQSEDWETLRIYNFTDDFIQAKQICLLPRPSGHGSLDTARRGNPSHLQLQKIFLTDPKRLSLHLGGGDCPQELTQPLISAFRGREIHIRSPKHPTPVSLHSAGVLRLHNRSLHAGEKTGRSKTCSR